MADGDGTGSAAKPWYDGMAGVDAEVIGHWQNKGLDKKTPQEVAVEATRARLAAEKHIGVPADQLLRMPKDAADEAAWKAIWTRLGKPADAKGYDFTTAKRADGTALDVDTEAFLREQSFKLNLPAATAAQLAQELVRREEAAATKAAGERTAKLAEAKAALKKNWGANEAANMFVASRAVAALGLEPETVNTLEGVIGYEKVMEMFRSIGSRIGEDKFITNGQDLNKGVMTREGAIARKAELMRDQAWTKAWRAGDAEKQREMLGLNTIISGQAMSEVRAG